VQVPVASLFDKPQNGALQTQLLFGEIFDVLEDAGAWVWGQSRVDGYVGYVASQAVQPGALPPSHWVNNLGTWVNDTACFQQPNTWLSYGSRVVAADTTVLHEHYPFRGLLHGGFVAANHLQAQSWIADDVVAEAFRFLGVPRIYGGRSGQGLDCSALVQLVFAACGFALPRDADQQQKALKKDVLLPDLRSGDLVFFKGHVALMIDDTNIIHANARAAAVSIDDLDEYRQWRIGVGDTDITAMKRVPL
jgi:cell wall-associated NlpC family hydrolase